MSNSAHMSIGDLAMKDFAFLRSLSQLALRRKSRLSSESLEVRYSFINLVDFY